MATVMRAFNVHPRQLLMPAFRVAAGTRTPATCRPSCSFSSPRPSLDDVERLSRGEASKAKIGSRAVPHRLNADERTAYELAKKRGYLVRQFRTRQYPVSNTYRNYCDAIGWPNLRIDQGPAGGLDTLVVDLTTLRLEEADLMALQREIRQAINSGSDEPKEENVLGKLNEVIRDATAMELEDSQSSILHFRFIRSDAKRLTQVVQGCCKMYVAASVRKMGS